MQSQSQQLKSFWEQQMQEVKEVPADTSVFKNHQLPLARIKKIMKSDEDVRMISAEAPVLFAKACELFILELTLRSWMHSEESKRRTLQRNDINAAITKTDVFDFLLDIVPREDPKVENSVHVPTGAGGVPPGAGMYGGVGVPQQMAYWPQGMPVPQQGGEGYPYAAMQQLQYAQQVPDQFPGVTGVQQDKNK
jgi:nuclear transcription factor Y gamma